MITLIAALVAALLCCANLAYAQLTVTVRDVNPDTSTLDPTSSNGASGGRVNGLAVDRTTPARVYGASEWGGLFRSVDGGVRWTHLDGHVPHATWDVEVDPTNSNRVYATSFYDGRTNSRSGINVSNDGGQTWTHPATARPPANFCLPESNRDEPSAFGISIDPANANRVFIGTNCGLAMSTDAGVTWTFVDATAADGARDVWDVVVHDGGIIDICGDDGHQRSIDNGVTWTTATGIPLGNGRCSIAVSPGEPYVLFAVSGNSLFESQDGGQNWPAAATYTNTTAQGRIPFVVVNRRQGATYDLWFGDRNLFRRTCTTPTPANPGGAARCAPATAWTNVDADAHDDVGDVAFAPGAAVDACPILFSNDGGIYRNTVAASPACHTPNWDQPTITPHALFNYSFAGSARAGAQPEDVYMGNQDNGNFGTTNAGAAAVTWTNEQCCDSFHNAGENTRAITTICCFAGATRMFRSAAGLGSPVLIPGPGGTLTGFQHLSTLLNFGADQYIVRTSTGIFVTANAGAATITWTPLGAASTPAGACGFQVAFSGGTPTFVVKSGGCNGDGPGTLWRHQGTATGGTWTQIPTPAGGGGFGVFGVDRNDPQHLIASHLATAGPRMVVTRNGGTTWTQLTALDLMMTGNGTFRYTNTSGPTLAGAGNNASLARNGYPQPTLVAFDPADSDIVVAGSADAGVFLSTNGGKRWQLVTDPNTPGASGVPHVPRAFYAHFDHDPPAGDINLFLGTRGRGAWRLTFKKVDMPEIQVPSPPDFAASCLGDTTRAPVLVCNTSPGDLIVNSVTSSNPQFSVTPPSGGFPITISHDFCFPVQVAFTPTAAGPASTNLVIASNDPTFPSITVAATANVGRPTAVTVIADTGKFEEFCAKPDAFRDLDLSINNSGSCPLLVTGIASSLRRVRGTPGCALPLENCSRRHGLRAHSLPSNDTGVEDRRDHRFDKRPDDALEDGQRQRRCAPAVRVRAADLRSNRRRHRADVGYRPDRQLHIQHGRNGRDAVRSREHLCRTGAGRVPVLSRAARGTARCRPSLSPRHPSIWRHGQLPTRQPSNRSILRDAQRCDADTRRAVVHYSIWRVRNQGPQRNVGGDTIRVHWRAGCLGTTDRCDRASLPHGRSARRRRTGGTRIEYLDRRPHRMAPSPRAGSG